MTGVGTLTRAVTGKPVMDPDTGQVTPRSGTVVAADVRCRVQAVTSTARPVNAGEEVVAVRGYLVSLPASVLAAVGDIFTLSACNDSALVGRRLRVADVMYGTETWQRDLFCTDDLG